MTDRCVMGLFSWNLTAFGTVVCCYGFDEAPFSRTFADPSGIVKENDSFGYPWLFCILQGPCAVDCVVGPVLVNAADCLVTSGCCSADDPEACCCVKMAGGFKEFDRLHWSLWKCSPLRAWFGCSDAEPLDDEKWKRNTKEAELRAAEERAAEERAVALAVKSQYIDRRFQTLPQR